MNKCVIVVLSALLTMPFTTLLAQPTVNQGMDEGGVEDMFVHPFLAHMGLPEMPNEVSLRITGYRTRFMGGNTEGDLAVHIEASLLKNVGLHIRADGIQHEDYSEVMVQYAVLADKKLHNGISLFGQVSIPTGEVKSNTYKGLFGISGRLTLTNVVVWDGNMHYDPKDKMIEHENAFVFRGSAKLYPILEIRGHKTKEMSEVYLLPAIKFRIDKSSAFGVGVQVAISDNRQFDTQGLFTYDVAF